MPSVTRLYNYFKPARYELSIKPDTTQMAFKGWVQIKGYLENNQNILRLHSKELNISSISVNDLVCTFSFNKENDELEIKLPDDTSGELQIQVDFDGKITKPMHGLYPCFGRNSEIILATQLESHHARELFPCIDEPEAKAVFALTLTTPAGLEVLSNTESIKETIKGKKQTTIFKDTPLMSCYLLAFVIGKLVKKELVTKHGVIVRAYACQDQANNLDFSLKVAKGSLEFFNRYFGIEYPLSKCDLVALPDFASGAMENWGLITFRETLMLVDPKNSSLDTKQYAAQVIAHELAHQWFGNLVTMRWWNDLWLNEGFASWIEYMAVDSLFPKWHMWTQFISSEQQSALRLDALKNTHPIEVPVPHPDEIKTIFDTISYNKGASVIHMLHQYLGPDDFKKGLQVYLKFFAYSTTVTDDLWQSLEQVSGKQVASFMSAWTSRGGFPMLDVKIAKNQLIIKQQRFTNDATTKTSDEPWAVPLQSHLISQKTMNTVKLVVKKPKNLDSFRLNEGQTGFYITKYWPGHYKQLGQQIRQDLLAESDRYGLLMNLLALNKSGYAPLARLTSFLRYFDNETSSPVWDGIATLLADIRRVMSEQTREAIKPLIRDLTAIQAERLGWHEQTNETYFDKLLRPTILALAAGADNESVNQTAKQMFDTAESPEQIPSNLRSMVLSAVSKKGGAAEFDRILNFYKNTSSPEDKDILGGALCNFRQTKECQRAIRMLKTSDVRIQDITHWLAVLLMNPVARDDMWQWITHNWPWLKKSLNGDISFVNMPIYVARVYSDSSFMKEYKSFFKNVNEPSLKRSIKQGVETIKYQDAWRKRDEKALLRWLVKLETKQ